jgi:hypothetical protein
MNKFKLIFVCLTVSVFSFTSCSSDDSSATGGQLMARWNPVKTTIKVGSQGTITQAYEGNEIGCNKDYIEFAANNVLRRVVYFRNADNVCSESAASTPASWSRSGDVITIMGDPTYEGQYEIIRLTGSELRLKGTSETGGISTVTTLYFSKAPTN